MLGKGGEIFTRREKMFSRMGVILVKNKNYFFRIFFHIPIKALFLL